MRRLLGRHREPSPEGLAFRATFDNFNLGDHPVGFGAGQCWLALRSDRPKLVAENLDAAVGASRWKTGMHFAGNDERLYVTPSVDGWVLVVGVEPTDEDLLRLSTTIGPTFGFDARPGRFGWARADGTTIERGEGADAEEVLAVAAERSLDPRSLADRTEPEGPGWLGRLVRLRDQTAPRLRSADGT